MPESSYCKAAEQMHCNSKSAEAESSVNQSSAPRMDNPHIARHQNKIEIGYYCRLVEEGAASLCN